MQRGIAGIGTFLLLLVGPPAGGAAVDVRTVATLRAPAPGTQLYFDALYAPVISDAGEVAFGAGLGLGLGYPDPQSSLWIWSDGALQPFAIEGDPAPGTGEPFGPLGGPLLNAASEVAFLTTFGDPNIQVPDRAFFAGPPAAPVLVLRLPATLVGYEWNDAGEILVSAGNTGLIKHSLFGGPPGAVAPVASLTSFDSGFAGPGRAYFGIHSNFRPNSYHVGPLAAPVAIFSEGDFLGPDLPGVRLRNLAGVVNSAGDGFFRASLFAGGVTSENAFAILRWNETSGFEVLLRSGEPVPGAAGLVLEYARDFVLGESGFAACRATLSDGSSGGVTALLAGDLEEGLSAVAVSGRAAPDLPQGSTLLGVGSPSHVRSDGLFVFGAFVEHADGDSRDALYVRAPSQAPRLLTQSGDTILIPPNRVRTVKGISIRTPEEPGPSSPASGKSLNEAGEVVVTLGYGSRSGIFVIDAATPVPEPGAGVLLAVGGVVLTATRALGSSRLRRRLP